MNLPNPKMKGGTAVKAGGQNTRISWTAYKSGEVYHYCPMDTGRVDDKGKAIYRVDSFKESDIEQRSVK